MCGADHREIDLDPGFRGTSPHVRGRPMAPRLFSLGAGNIPACAGQTNFCWSLSRSFAEHPRMCGADNSSRSTPRRRHGTSPHVRGRLDRSSYHTRRSRNIPACAGQTRPWSLTRATRREHPRMCGADMRISTRQAALGGTSPHVRGRPAGS